MKREAETAKQETPLVPSKSSGAQQSSSLQAKPSTPPGSAKASTSEHEIKVRSNLSTSVPTVTESLTKGPLEKMGETLVISWSVDKKKEN